MQTYRPIISVAFPKSRLLLDDFPTTRKVFHRSYVASRQYFALPHRPLLRAERKGHPVLETAGMWPRRTLRPIPALCRLGKHASERHWWLTEVEYSPKQAVVRARSTRCFVPWQIVGPVRRATILSGFSLRKKSIEFCSKV